MRTDLNFKLVCSNCGRELECDPDHDDTDINFHSAHNAEASMAIKPCAHCYEEARRPAKLMKEAMSEV